MTDIEAKQAIQNALAVCSAGNLTENAIALWTALGYNTRRKSHFAQKTYAYFKEHYADTAPDSRFNEAIARVDEWRSVDMLFQLSTKEMAEQLELFDAKQIGNTVINSYLVFAVELENAEYSRTKLSAITREINKVFPMPVMVVWKYGALLTLSVIHRRLNKKDSDRDVLEKVTLIKDISIANPHRAHIEILFDLSLDELSRQNTITNFVELHEAWQKTLDTRELNKRFYAGLVDWYGKCLADIRINLAAASRVLNKKIDDELKPQAVIRVIIRLMFMWFMLEKKLLPKNLFTRESAKEFLSQEDTFYNAVLQNLFFAVLNKKIDERRFRKNDKTNFYNPETNDYGVCDVFRYKNFFKDDKAEAFVALTEKIPFVNGGLFMCHDYKFSGLDTVTGKRNTEQNYIIDGFSDNPNDRAVISDSVIFALIDLLNSYKWTIEEATPAEQEIALDPELLGTVFENLIGFYNPETKESARKATGSFYTPREIVDYMCKESLKIALASKLPHLREQIADIIESNEDHFDFPGRNDVVDAITSLKILDPACGSGAFPMGMFTLMVKTVEKLWNHKTTYDNKLDIITKCIYGVDIQNIAIEISKLRFFISLLVDYEVPTKIEDFEVLPNLETKFTAANTLIGINLAGGDLFNAQLLEHCKELTGIFTPFTKARTPKEKETIKNAFEAKKQELVRLLVDNNMAGSEVEKVSAWNPFNVCYTSPFFDSAIMFGVADGFDVVVGNPPYGADIDDFIKLFEILYTETSHGFKDIYKYFFEKCLSLLNKNGCLSFITPNTFLRQPRYGDLRRLLLKHNIRLLVDLGEHIFEAVVPTAITLVSRIKDKNICFVDLTKSTDAKTALKNIYYNFIEQTSYEDTPNNIFIKDIRKKKDNEVLLGDVLDMKDAGINYQRVNVGLSDKGNSNLSSRLLYEGEQKKGVDVEYWKGTDINSYFISENTGRYVKPNIKLNENERVILNKDYFEISPKLLWRQTAQFPIAVIDKKGIWFGRSIQAGTIKNIFKDKICYEYLCALLNSKYLRYLYENIVKEEGRVFPQVKLEKLKSLPIILTENQQPIIALVDQILAAKAADPQADTQGLEQEIDRMVYSLYGLTAEEVQVVEGKG